MLKLRLKIFLRFGLFWLCFFAISRLFFLIYNFRLSANTPINQLVLSFIHGFKLDLSLTGYILFFLSLVFIGTFAAKGRLIKKIVSIYSLMFLIPFSIVTITDMELYRNWGYRMDSTILLYLKTPKEAMASTKVWLSIVLVLATSILIWGSYKLLKNLVLKHLNDISGKNWWTIPVFLLAMGVSFVFMRGSLGIAPINTGAVYFSEYAYANHAAVNVHWQLGYSVSQMNRVENISYLNNDVAQSTFNNLYAKRSDSLTSFTNIENPNIIIIILESFSSRMVEPLGGLEGVTPNINQLTKQGILFSHCFANGSRSDKGIVSILSGYPAQPKTSIIKSSVKAEKLPFLSEKLNSLGYHSSFYYGGDINFANMRSYLVNSKFHKLVTLFDFDEKDRNSKWGIHDHVVFQRFFKDCNTVRKPFFKAYFTLSSHEPFDVPFHGKFDGKDEESMFLNAANYTDSCLGDFINKAKLKSWWDSTLVICVPDHTTRWPGNVPASVREKFEIPLLIVGGALNVTDTLIDTYINQIDIPTLIGQQLKQNFTDFTFSKSNFTGNESFAFYAFNNGFGFVKDSAFFVFDNTSKQIISENKEVDELTLKQGKSYMQVLINDYNSK